MTKEQANVIHERFLKELKKKIKKRFLRTVKYAIEIVLFVIIGRLLEVNALYWIIYTAFVIFWVLDKLVRVLLLLGKKLEEEKVI